MPVSKSMWARGLRSDYAKLKENIRLERDTKTVQISMDWRKGFTALKDENDRLQMVTRKKYEKEMADAAVSLKEGLAGKPPEGVSRSNWEKGWREDTAKWRSSAAIDRDVETKEISRKWKEGFKALKEENDRRQLECKETFYEKMRENDTWLKEQLAMGPPK